MYLKMMKQIMLTVSRLLAARRVPLELLIRVQVDGRGGLVSGAAGRHAVLTGLRGDGDEVGVMGPGGLANDVEQLLHVDRGGGHEQLRRLDERLLGPDALAEPYGVLRDLLIRGGPGALRCLPCFGSALGIGVRASEEPAQAAQQRPVFVPHGPDADPGRVAAGPGGI